MDTLRRRWSNLPDLQQCVGIDDLLIRGADPSWSKLDSYKFDVVIRAFL